MQTPLLQLLPSLGFPTTGTAPSLPVLPPGATVGEAQNYIYGAVNEDDISSQFGLASAHDWLISPEIGTGMLIPITLSSGTHIVADTYAGYEMQSNSMCLGGATNMCPNSAAGSRSARRSNTKEQQCRRWISPISLGDIVTTTIFAASAITFIVSIQKNGKFLAQKMDIVDEQNEMRFQRIDAQIEDSKVEMKKLGDILVELTKHDGRMNTLDERMLTQGKRIDSMASTLRDVLMGRQIPITPG